MATGTETGQNGPASSADGFECSRGGNCPCKTLDLVNGRVIFVGIPSQECSHNVAYGDGRVCVCARRNRAEIDGA